MKKALAALAGTILLLSACAGSGSSASDDPKGALIDALRGLLETDAITQTITVDSDTASLVAVSDGDIDEETAQKILDSSLTASGRQAEDPEDASSQVILNVAGTEALEMRFVAGDLFVRVEVADLLETFGEDSAELDALSAQIKGQKGFEWVEPALAGEWVVVEDVLALTQQMGGATFSGEDQKRLVNDLLESVEQNATVTYEGDDDAGEHVRAGLPLKATFENLMQAAPGAGMTGAALQDALNDVPEGDVVIDFWISDGRVSRIALDVTQFEKMAEDVNEDFPRGVEKLTIAMDIDDFSGEVEAVPDAIAIDTTALSEALSGLLMGGLGQAGGTAPGGSQFDCNMLKGAPPDVIELYAEECPELQKN